MVCWTSINSSILQKYSLLLKIKCNPWYTWSGKEQNVHNPQTHSFQCVMSPYSGTMLQNGTIVISELSSLFLNKCTLGGGHNVNEQDRLEPYVVNIATLHNLLLGCTPTQCLKQKFYIQLSSLLPLLSLSISLTLSPVYVVDMMAWMYLLLFCPSEKWEFREISNSC